MATSEDRFAPPADATTLDARFDDEPTPLPAPPTRIMGLPPDTWALGIERKIDAVFTAQHEALLTLAENNRAAREEVRDGFARISESLKVIERHELALQKQQTQLDEHRRILFAVGDRQNEIVERQDELAAEQQALKERVAALEAKPAEKPAAPRKPTKGSTPGKRARRK